VPPPARWIAAIFRRFVLADYESVMRAANSVAADPGRSGVPPRAIGGRALVLHSVGASRRSSGAASIPNR
jgi:hypothetical protein